MEAGAFPERRAGCKDGREITIRRVREADFESARETTAALLAAGVGQIRSPDEMPPSAEEFRESMLPWISGDHAGYKGLYVVALLGARVVGSGRVRRPAFKRLRHNGNLGLGVHPMFHGLGIGRALMTAMIDWARNHSFVHPERRSGGLTRLDLYVFADNHRAIRLYESLGFTRIGVRHGYIRKEDGSVLDDFLMELLL